MRGNETLDEDGCKALCDYMATQKPIKGTVGNTPQSIMGVTPSKPRLDVPKQMPPFELRLLCAEFYWTVSLMFGLSNSVLPVGIYHHLMYSMPTFVTRYQLAVDEASTSASSRPHSSMRIRLTRWRCGRGQ